MLRRYVALLRGLLELAPELAILEERELAALRLTTVALLLSAESAVVVDLLDEALADIVGERFWLLSAPIDEARDRLRARASAGGRRRRPRAAGPGAHPPRAAARALRPAVAAHVGGVDGAASGGASGRDRRGPGAAERADRSARPGVEDRARGAGSAAGAARRARAGRRDGAHVSPSRVDPPRRARVVSPRASKASWAGASSSRSSRKAASTATLRC